MTRVAEPPRRLFIGLFPDPAVQVAIIRHRNSWDWPRGSGLTRAHRLHLTLHFLGYVDVPLVAPLQAALSEASMEALNLDLSTPQAWRGGVAVLLPEENAGLQALHDRLAVLLRDAGLNPPRSRWKPHLTIAREAGEAGPPGLPASIPWTVHQFAVARSQD